MPDNLSFQANMEQFGAMAEAISKVIAQYHKGLILAEVPPDLASMLTKDFAAVLWQKFAGSS